MQFSPSLWFLWDKFHPQILYTQHTACASRGVLCTSTSSLVSH